MANANLRAALFALAGCLLASSPAWADWTEYGGDPEHHLVSSEKITAPLAVAWKHTTNVYAEKVGNMGGPVVSGGLVFFPSKNRIIAVDAASGEVKWRVPEGDVNDPKIPHITATPAVNGDMIFVPDSSDTMTAYSVADGTEAWRFRTQQSVRSAPTIVGDYLYFGSDDGFVYCVSCKDGSLRWKSNDRGKSFQLSDAIAASPTYYNGVIYVNSSDLKMWALQADTGRVMWLQRLGAPSVDISPVAYNGKIFLAAGSTIYQFHLRGGQYHAYSLQQWVNNDITSTPIITEKAWYFGDRDGYFHAFNNLGKPLMNDQGKEWKVKLEGKAQGTPILTSDTLYVSTDKGFVYGIDPKKGEITWSYRTEAPKGISPLYSYYAIRAPLAASDGQLYVVGDDGTLTCLRSDAADDDGPMITTPRPSRGVVMNGSPPIYISAYMWDEGSGINPDTIELLIDGKPVERSAKPYYEKQIGDMDGWVYDPLKRMVHFTTAKGEKDKPEPTLINGRHKIQIQALDWHGNASSLEWSFVVDNSLPRNAIATTPKAGSKNQGNNPYGGPGNEGGPNGQRQNNNQKFRGRGGGYQYQNRGQGGYGFGNQGGGYGGSGGGGYGGGGGGFGNRGGGGGGRGGFGF